MTLLCYLIPFFLIIYIMLMFTFQMMGPYKGIIENIFSFFYIIFGWYFGYLLYIFLTSIIIRIIDACVDIPVNVGIPILYGLPGLICIYGVINNKSSKNKFKISRI